MSGTGPTTLSLPEGSWWDWDVVEWTRGSLTLAADADFSYHHQLELRFHQVAYVSCPAEFHDPVFRHPTDRECDLVRRAVGELRRWWWRLMWTLRLAQVRCRA